MCAAKKRRSGRIAQALLAVYISTLLVATALVISLLLVGRPAPEPIASGSQEAPPAPTSPDAGPLPVPESVPPSDEAPGVAGRRPQLIIVLDDAGHNLWQLQAFLELPFPLTIAVLPGLPYTAESARLSSQAGKELILHQPMEAINGQDPGPGSIASEMDDEAVRQRLRANMAQLEGASGMNNHMGSRATADTRLMDLVLAEVRAAGWYFLDSLTTHASVAAVVAESLNMKIWERTVFLDNSPERAEIVARIRDGLRVADQRGYAVMIGHVWSAELAQTLADLYPQLVEEGYSFSTISRLMMGIDDADIGD